MRWFTRKSGYRGARVVVLDSLLHAFTLGRSCFACLALALLFLALHFLALGER